MFWLPAVACAAFWLRTAFANDCTGIKAVSPDCKTPETAYHRDIFYVGGKYIPFGNTTQSIYSGQLYVEKLTPAHPVKHDKPLIFISAGVPSGVVWLNTPDNRQGWASYFLDQGYLVYIIDITSNGRSSQEDIASFPTRIGSTDFIHENSFTAPELSLPYPQAAGHDQFPGNGTRGDPIFDAFFAAAIPLTSNTTSQELSMRSAGCALLELIGRPSYVISHSNGAVYSVLMSDECPSLIAGNVNLEPGNVPFQSLIGNSTVPSVGFTRSRPWGLANTKLKYSPAITNSSLLHPVSVGPDTPGNRSCYIQSPANNVTYTLPNLADIPYVLLTGSASPHITYDHCFPLYLNQVGVKSVEWIQLGEIGIVGNAHFSMIEKNNLEIAEVIKDWLERHEK